MYLIFARETLTQMKFEGKLAAQAAHAGLHAFWDAEDLARVDPEYAKIVDEYKNGNDARKISLVVDTVSDLKWLKGLYEDYMGVSLVEDCGYTVFSESTITALGLGPINDEFLEGSLLKSLPLLGNEIHVT